MTIRTSARLTCALAVALSAVVVSMPSGDVAGETQVRWLAMGDSYSSGEGIPGTNPGNAALQGKDNCVRANGDGTDAKAWAVVAAETLGSSSPGYTFERPFFVACTGAIVDDATTQLAEMRSQVTDASLQKWNIVSFSFGGNSIGFADVIKGCLDLNSVWGAFDLTPGCDISIEELRRRIDMLAGKTALDPDAYVGNVTLPTMYDAVAEAVAPGGHVLVLGYPQLVEEVAKWDSWRRKFLSNCEGVRSYDVGMLRSAAGYLNEQIALAVQAADSRWESRGVRFHFVDIATNVYETSSDPGSRHALCSAEPWLNGQTVGVMSGDWRTERSFHPYQRGHTATGEYLAGLLRDATTFSFELDDGLRDECDPRRVASDLGREAVDVEICEAAWSYADLCVGESECGDSQAILRLIDNRWVNWMMFPQPTVCRDDMVAAEAPAAIVDRVVWACEGRREVLSESNSFGFQRISALETELVARGLLASADGTFDGATTAAVRTFQDRLGLDADGLAGPSTLAALGAGLGNIGTVTSVDEAVAEMVRYLNDESDGRTLPPDARAALTWAAFDFAEWSTTGTAVEGERHLVNLVLSGDGGVYTYGTVCLIATNPVTWCGIYEINAH